MIHLRNLSKHYETPAGRLTALDNINLDVASGEIYGVIGRSGAGKSSLIRCVNLLERPSTGSIEVNKLLISELSPAELRDARRQIGMIFQHFNLLSSQTIYHNVALPLILLGKSKTDIEKMVMPLLELTGLSDKKSVYPGALSGGQKQRVAIARALAHQPKVLLCDEATSALDPETTHSILNLLKDINKQLGVTILLITHEMDVVKNLCDKVAVLEKGRIISEASTLDFFTRPQHVSYLQQALPQPLQERLVKEASESLFPVWRIYFQGAVTTQPLIAHLIQQLGLDINIIQGNIEYIQQAPAGMLLVEVRSDKEKVDRGLAFLASKGLTVEELGYVA